MSCCARVCAFSFELACIGCGDGHAAGTLEGVCLPDSQVLFSHFLKAACFRLDSF